MLLLLLIGLICDTIYYRMTPCPGESECDLKSDSTMADLNQEPVHCQIAALAKLWNLVNNKTAAATPEETCTVLPLAETTMTSVASMSAECLNKVIERVVANIAWPSVAGLGDPREEEKDPKS